MKQSKVDIISVLLWPHWSNLLAVFFLPVGMAAILPQGIRPETRNEKQVSVQSNGVAGAERRERHS
ncbi:MAG: hypothetical protein ABI670_23175, partial [Chloroflexota bacterium]